ncbi:MAG: sodium-dependent transporter [Gammaproteobacteria bacterium]|nr:sodium-dependent transporter [Gammaproteobacteria bacterium]
MATERTSIHGQWSGRLAFILAATGSAVGLGNIWKFPYITGEYGGGAFVLVYLLCVIGIGIPIMMAEVMLGRRGRQSPINTMTSLAAEEGQSHYWKYLGWTGVIAGFLILSYYSVIGGWAMAYIFRMGSGGLEGQTMDGVGSIFVDLVSDPERLIAWHTIFITLTMIVVARGVKSGLEKAVRYLMPALLVLLLVLVGYAMNEADFGAGIDYLFTPDFSKITGTGILAAMGHAFFTLSLGMGAIMVYGSYLPKDISIAKTSIIISLADTAVALLAGMAIFPLVFTYNLGEKISADPGLLFNVFPYVFGQMPGGTFFGTLFFILLTFAAWTSAISLIEPGVAWMVENRGLNRVKAAVWAGITTWALGIASIFAFSGTKLGDIFYVILGVFGIRAEFTSGFFDLSFFNMIDYLTANIMLPLGGMSIAIFAGWLMTEESRRDEMAIQHPALYLSWLYLVRYVAPLAVIIVFLKAVGIF